MKTRLVYYAHFWCALPECWQRQSDCRIVNITWEKCNKHEAQRAPTKMYVLYTLYACSFDLANTSMADYEVRISKVISYATKALGYSELRPNQELAVKHFLRGLDVFVSLPIGSGKSLCYCLLPKALDFLWQRIESTQSMFVVVSPPSCPQISEAYVVRRGTSVVTTR